MAQFAAYISRGLFSLVETALILRSPENIDAV